MEVWLSRNTMDLLKFTVYWKATSTNQYLNFTSNHPLIHKLGVIRTHNRADNLVTEQDDKEKRRNTPRKHSTDVST